MTGVPLLDILCEFLNNCIQSMIRRSGLLKAVECLLHWFLSFHPARILSKFQNHTNTSPDTIIKILLVVHTAALRPLFSPCCDFLSSSSRYSPYTWIKKKPLNIQKPNLYFGWMGYLLHQQCHGIGCFGSNLAPF